MRMKGKGRLTDRSIKKLTKSYGKAIRSNIDDSAAMKEMLYGKYFTIHSPQIACHNTSFVPVGSGLGASIIVHLPSQSHHPTHPPSIQTLSLICSRSLSGSPRPA